MEFALHMAFLCNSILNAAKLMTSFMKVSLFGVWRGSKINYRYDVHLLEKKRKIAKKG